MKQIVILMISALVFASCQQSKTAYVNNKEVMDGFEQLKASEEKFKTEEEEIKARMDSIVNASGYQDLVQEYQRQQGKISKAKQEELYNQIMQIQQNLGQQQQATSQQFQQKKIAEMDSLLKTVKDFVKEYGKDNGYTYIYGANESGNIMYADESLDITQDIINALNEEYLVENSSTKEVIDDPDSTEK